MRKDLKILLGVAVVAIGALVVGTRVYRSAEKKEQAAAAAQRPGPDPEVLVRPDSPSKGPKDAKVTIVEFLDPECESCRAMHPIVKKVLAESGDKVRLVLRYMPLHQNSVYAASALEAAGEQGKYWEMLEVLFENQPAWGDHHAPKPQLIPDYAAQIGLDMGAFERSVNAAAHKAKVERDKQDGVKLGVRGTPTFFVNGRQLENLGYGPLKAIVEEELKK